jgi:rubrerythrin
MAIEFNADEMFKMAEQIEMNGAAFYRKAAGMFAGKAPEKTLAALALMEDTHLETFRQMHSTLSAGEQGKTAFDPEGEAELYLKAFADGHVFDTSVAPADRLEGGESLADILRMAIGLEKDSVAFYTGLRHLVPARLGKEKVENIIGEEMSHITILSRQLAAAV